MMEKVDVTFSRPRGIAIHAAAWLGRRGDWRSRHTGKTRARRDVREKHPGRERLRKKICTGHSPGAILALWHGGNYFWKWVEESSCAKNGLEFFSAPMLVAGP